VISADLIFGSRENRRAFSKQNVVSFLEKSELPLDERIIIWIYIGSDEGSSVINSDTESLEIFSCEGMEISCPEFGISEFRNILFRNIHFL